MNTDHKEKVKRWKIAIQHYDFDVQHIKGKFNVEADALSRLVPTPEKSANAIHVLEETETIKDISYHEKCTTKYNALTAAWKVMAE